MRRRDCSSHNTGRLGGVLILAIVFLAGCTVLPGQTPTATPDLDATVEARVQQRLATPGTSAVTPPAPSPTANPTATPTPTATPKSTATPTATPRPTNTPTPQVHTVTKNQDLQLDAFAWTLAWTGHESIIGIVTNRGQSTLPGVSVTIRFRNQATMTEVDTREASVLLMGEIGPGEKVPFVAFLPEPEKDGTWDTAEVLIELGGLFYRRVNGLEVTQTTRLDNGVSGTIRNGSEGAVGGIGVLEGLQVAVIGYDALGKIVVVGGTSVKRILEPDWTTTFRIVAPGLIFGKTDSAVTYEARVLAAASNR